MKKLKRLFITLVAVLMVLTYAPTKVSADTVVAKIGNNEYATLADALNAADSGATVEVLGGTWGADAIGEINNSLVRTKSLTIKPVENAVVTFTSDVYIGYDDNTTSNATITVKDFKFENASLKILNYVQVTVENCSFVGSGTVAALYIGDSCDTNHKTSDAYLISQVTVRDCTVNGTASGVPGIRLRNSGNVTLTDNVVTNVRHNGILLESNAAIDSTPVKTISITGNTITEWNADDVIEGGRGMRLALGTLAEGSNITINNNRLTKANVGLDAPDFVKITGAANATANLSSNYWNNQTLETVQSNNNNAYYTSDTSTTTITSVINDPVETNVAKIGTTEYATLQGAVDAATTGQIVELINNVDLSNTVVVRKTITLNLAGYTISNTKDIWSDDEWSLISVRDDGKLTINDTAGTGALVAKENDCYAIDVTGDGATLTINGGTYNGNVTAIYAHTGAVTINGGTFIIQQLYPDYRFTLNCLDANYANGTASFAVYGGSFYNYDPSNNLAEGANTNFVAPGYEVKQSDDYYTVSQIMVAKIGTTEYPTLAAAIAAVPTDGTETTITMIGNEKIVANTGVTVTKNQNIVLDLNGHKIESFARTASTSYVIQNLGTLYIKDSQDTDKNGTGGGYICGNAAYPDETSIPSYASNTIRNLGHLTIESGFIESKGTGSASYAIDNDAENAQWSATVDNVVSLTITGGKFRSNTSVTIRQYLDTQHSSNDNDAYDNIVSISNADMGSLWVQDNYNKDKDYCATKGSLTIDNTTFMYSVSVGYWCVAKNFTANISNSTLTSLYWDMENSYDLTTSNNKYKYYYDMTYLSGRSEAQRLTDGLYANDRHTNSESGYTWTNYLSDMTKNGYEVVELAEGDEGYAEGYRYKVVQSNNVAQIGDVKYESLKDAIDSVESDSATIKMLVKSYDLSTDKLNDGGYLNIAPVNKAITLDLNGASLYGASLDVYGTLTITNNANTNIEGTITGTKHGVYVNNGATLNVENGTITNTGAGYPVIAYPGNVNISGGTIKNTTGNYSAVYVSNGTLSVTGGTIESDKDGTDAISINGTTVANVSGGSIKGHDWGITALGTSTLNVSGTAVITTDDSEGYAISTNGNSGQNATINISGGTITGKELGIYQPSGKLTISGGTITGATGVYFKSNSLNITGGTINGNGAAADYEYNSNGANTTGDALVIDSCGYPNGINDVSVSGGQLSSTYAKAVAVYTYTTNTPVENFITGGKYSSEPDSSYVASGYKAAPISESPYLYEVGVATTTATTTGTTSDDSVTYEVNTTVTENVTENPETLQTIEDLKITVTGRTVETTSEGTASLGDIKNTDVLGNIVKSAVEAAGSNITPTTQTASIVIQLAKSEAAVDTTNNKATYEVHPEAVISVGGNEVGTVKLLNNQINGTFSFKLYALNIQNVVVGDKILVTHTHDNGTSEEIGPFIVDDNGYITVTGITSFSEFTLEEYTETGESAKFGYTIALDDSIDIIYNVKNLTGDLSKWTVTYVDPDTGTEVTVNPTNATLNSYTIAKCAAKEMGDKYTVIVKYNGVQKNKTTEFSIKKYCDEVLNNANASTELKDICKAVLDYGRYAQETFNYKTDALVNGGSDYFTNANISVPPYAATKEYTVMPEGISKTSLTLVTTSKTQLIVYFKDTNPIASIDGYTVRVDGNKVTPTLENGKIKVTITGIAAIQLGTRKVITITDSNNNTLTYRVSPTDYMGLAVTSGSQIEVNRAFYNYYLKAVAYFATK